MIKKRENSFSLQDIGLHFSKGKLTYVRTDWEITHLGYYMELGWRLKVFSNLVFEFYYTKVRFLSFVLEFKFTCYLMNKVDPCVASIVGFIWDAKPVFTTNGIRENFNNMFV